MGAIAWMLALTKAVEAGVTNSSFLADMCFYMHYPDRIGRALEAGEEELIKQWKSFRYFARIELRRAGKSEPSNGTSPTVDESDGEESGAGVPVVDPAESPTASADEELADALEVFPMLSRWKFPHTMRVRLLRMKVCDGLRGRYKVDDYYKKAQPPYSAYMVKEVRRRCSGLEGTALAMRFWQNYGDIMSMIEHTSREIDSLVRVVGADDAAVKRSPDCEFGRWAFKKASQPLSVYFCLRDIVMPTYDRCREEWVSPRRKIF